MKEALPNEAAQGDLFSYFQKETRIRLRHVSKRGSRSNPQQLSLFQWDFGSTVLLGLHIYILQLFSLAGSDSDLWIMADALMRSFSQYVGRQVIASVWDRPFNIS